MIRRFLVVGIASVGLAACGAFNLPIPEEEGWSCEDDTLRGLGGTRSSGDDSLIGCRGAWTCESHDYTLDCTRSEAGLGWDCACKRDGFTINSFQNEDICQVSTGSGDVAEKDRAARLRVNAGCIWELPIRE